MRKWIVIIWVAALTGITLFSIPQCTWTDNGLFNRFGDQSALDPKGPVAANQYDIFMLTLYVSIFLFITVGGTLALATWRFRLKKTDDPKAIPHQSHGHPLVEIGLVAASAALLVVIAVPTFGGIVLKKVIPEHLQEDAITINVTGFQWWWAFEYPELGFHTANEIYIPVGRAVRLNLRTDDVIHSFWIPKLAGKVDLMAGQQNDMWILADEPGTYMGQCAEYCGESHAYMLFRAHAVPEAEFQAWVERQKQAPTVLQDGLNMPVKAPAEWTAPEDLVMAGANLFGQHCARCHSLNPTVQLTGPNLAHFATRTTLAAGWMRNNAENLHKWIKTPHLIKPGNHMWGGFYDYDRERDEMAMVMQGLVDSPLNDSQVDALVAYLYTLK